MKYRIHVKKYSQMVLLPLVCSVLGNSALMAHQTPLMLNYQPIDEVVSYSTDRQGIKPNVGMNLPRDYKRLTMPSPYMLDTDMTATVGVIDQYRERKIGEAVYRQIHQQLNLVQDVWLEEELLSIFQTIFSQAQLGEPLALLVVNDPQINAFAVPGGLFAVNLGLILSAKTIDEVAGVMAHEVAHISQRHYSRSKDAFKGQSALMLAGLLLGAAVAAKGEGDAGTAVMMGTQAALIDQQLRFSREQEREADRIGMQYLYRAGFSPSSMADFFETMYQQHGASREDKTHFLYTHPLTSERMNEARLRAYQYPQPAPQLQANDRQFNLLRYYSGVLTKKMSESELLILAKQRDVAAQLALVKYYLLKGETLLADRMLQQISPKTLSFAQARLYYVLKADNLIAKQQYVQAQELLTEQLTLMPENRVLNYKLAELFLVQKQGASAEKVLQPFMLSHQKDARLWQLLTQTQAINVKDEQERVTIKLLRYRAEMEFWSGAEEKGIKTLLHAERLAKQYQHTDELTTIRQRLKVMQQDYRLQIDG